VALMLLEVSFYDDMYRKNATKSKYFEIIIEPALIIIYDIMKKMNYDENSFFKA
jgi:hypothetical protein